MVSTLFHHMYSWPLPAVQVVLQASVQVWQAMHLLMSKTAANCLRGRDSGYQYDICLSICQFRTSDMVSDLSQSRFLETKPPCRYFCIASLS